MKMHSRRFKDPLIAGAQPITILGPLIEESLRLARIRPDREQLVERFMAGQPRIAVVHGSEDHPASVGCRDQAHRLIRQVWAEGGLPVEVSQAVPSEELSRGLPGVHYAFLARNVCAANFGTLMESHGYDAAIVLGTCDKLLVGVLRALIEADLARQRRKCRPVYASVIPTSVGPEVHLDEPGRRRFEEFRGRLPEPEGECLFSLIRQPINGEIYGKFKACLDEAFHKRAILESEKDELEQIVAMRALSPGADSRSSEASIITRLMVATFGVVPRDLELSLNPPDEEQVSRVIRRLLQGIEKRERRISVAHLVKSNLQNSVSVWSSIGGDPSWLLHLNYLAEGLGTRLSSTLLSRRLTKVPYLLSFDGHESACAPGVAAESDAGGNSGIDTLMRTLSEKRFIDDRAATLDGSWMQRIMEARSANGNYFHSTITPRSPNCGLYPVAGNLAETALARLSLDVSGDSYDKKVYLADYFLGHDELLKVMEKPGGLLERIRKKVTQPDLTRTWSINWKSKESSSDLLRWDKKRVWAYLLEQELLRLIVFVAGEGPRASGMPRIWFPDSRDHELIQKTCVLVTDGRIAFPHVGLSISHVVPEAIEGGAIASVRAGDWVYLNLRKGEFQIVTAAKNAAGFRPLNQRELKRRTEARKRLQELEHRRAFFLPSVRSVFDNVTSAAEGVSPVRV